MCVGCYTWSGSLCTKPWLCADCALCCVAAVHVLSEVADNAVYVCMCKTPCCRCTVCVSILIPCMTRFPVHVLYGIDHTPPQTVIEHSWLQASNLTDVFIDIVCTLVTVEVPKLMYIKPQALVFNCHGDACLCIWCMLIFFQTADCFQCGCFQFCLSDAPGRSVIKWYVIL